MKVIFHRNFEKRYKKLRKNEQERFKEKVLIFMKDQFDPVLNNHPLHGKYKGYRSINVSGDLRAIYKMIKPDIFLFIVIDKHNKLYS